MIAIVNYGASNLSSVAKAIASLGYSASLVSSPVELMRADVVVLPGVGAAGDAMFRLESLGLADAIRVCVSEGRPFLGICLGLQIILTQSEESGGRNCLNLIPGRVVRLPTRLKVPHMGWNQVSQRHKHPLFSGIPENTNFYFVHSYYALVDDESVVIGETDYDISFASVLVKDNIVATQFHPEKSGSYGLRLLQNFLQLSVKAG